MPHTKKAVRRVEVPFQINKDVLEQANRYFLAALVPTP